MSLTCSKSYSYQLYETEVERCTGITEVNVYFYIYTYVSRKAFWDIKYSFSLSPIFPCHGTFRTLNIKFLSVTTHLNFRMLVKLQKIFYK